MYVKLRCVLCYDILKRQVGKGRETYQVYHLVLFKAFFG